MFDFMSTYVAGTPHHTTAKYILTVAHGDVLTLVREPENTHDANAIRVMHGENKLGYIPAVIAGVLASLFDHGYVLDATVDHVAPSRLDVTITLRMEDKISKS